VTTGSFLERLMVVNVFLAVFNLIPAFPMDGGRILRALLATRLNYNRATSIAAGVGQAIAFMFGFIGIFGNPFLVFIALFVWIGAAQEANMTQLRSALSAIPVRTAMITDFKTLATGDTLGQAVDLILRGSQHDFPVIGTNGVEGILLRSDLMVALSKDGIEGRVADVMKHEFETVDDSEMLESAFARMNASACQTAPVLRTGKLVGLITMENVGEFVMIQSALASRQPNETRWIV